MAETPRFTAEGLGLAWKRICNAHEESGCLRWRSDGMGQAFGTRPVPPKTKSTSPISISVDPVSERARCSNPPIDKKALCQHVDHSTLTLMACSCEESVMAPSPE